LMHPRVPETFIRFPDMNTPKKYIFFLILLPIETRLWFTGKGLDIAN
jgi:hypothetical protein